MNKNQKFIIKGLAGEKSLNGKVKINGAKNSALKAMAGSILFDDEVVLNNIPDTEDIHTMREILIDLGAKVEWQDNNTKSKVLKIDTKGIYKTDIKANFAKTMRASVVLTGPLLARFGKVSFPAPGGCVIGARPIDLFIEGYKKMGATVTLQDDLYFIEAKNGLVGMKMLFNKVSVGGTETLMMAATLADGITILENCATEPEIGNVAEWLNENGADIKGMGTTTLVIKGLAGKLFSNKKDYIAIPDRIEAGSYLILGALCAERLEIQDCRPDHIGQVIDMLRDSGVNISIIDSGNGANKNSNGVNKTIVVSNDKSKPDFRFKAFNVETKVFPGFATDLQSPIVVFLTQSEGESSVTETIFEGRFKYIEDLVEMGALITKVDQDKILIKGPTPFRELSSVGVFGDLSSNMPNNLPDQVKSSDTKELSAHDIRAGFAIVLACLLAKGNFVVNNIHLIDRGYESLELKLQALGADVERK